LRISVHHETFWQLLHNGAGLPSRLLSTRPNALGLSQGLPRSTAGMS
jgi:hypothetical protein